MQRVDLYLELEHIRSGDLRFPIPTVLGRALLGSKKKASKSKGPFPISVLSHFIDPFLIETQFFPRFRVTGVRGAVTRCYAKLIPDQPNKASHSVPTSL